METISMEQAIAQFRSEQNESQNSLSRQTVCRLNDGRAIRQINENQLEVTLYKGTPATKGEIANETAQLMLAYPKMNDSFMAVLMQQIVEDRWTIERVRDAVKHILRSQKYQQFTIGEFMSFDKPMRLYTHSGYQWLINNGRAKDADACGDKSDFGKIYVNKGTPQQKCFWYLKKDLPKNLSY